MSSFKVTDEDIIAAFPFENIREPQFQALRQIMDAFDKGYRHVILQAPTGAGKSGIAVTISRLFQKVDPSFKSVTSTMTKYLQDQYFRDFNFLADIRSASDERYRCSVGALRNTEECLEHKKKTEKKCEVNCPYKLAGKKFAIGPYSLTNAQFFVRYPRRKELAIIDECHELSNVISSVVEIPSFKLDPTKISLIVREDTDRLVEAFERVQEMYDHHKHGDVFNFPIIDAETFDFNFDLYAERLEGLVGTKEFRIIQRHFNAMTNAVNRMMLSSGREMIMVVEKDQDGRDFKIVRPVYADAFTDDLVFSKANRFLHMSATICGFKAYAEEMGIPDGEWIGIDVAHSIPAERREFRVEPVSWMSAKTEERDHNLIAKKVEELYERHDKPNTILHTGSYKRAERVTELMSIPNKFVPRSAVDALEILKNHKDAVVASPSLVAGVDGKDDLCRLNIICKVPYPSFGDPRIRHISKNRPEIINQMIVRNIVQAAGRGTRHENDWSYTYILDGVFDRVYGENTHLFPTWFVEAMRWAK